jgi:predicted regulator of Ras-like GTPase activity (Roadblock/LC7/MglB family)
VQEHASRFRSAGASVLSDFSTPRHLWILAVLVLDSRFQPALESLIQRMGEEISAKAVMILLENGQVISHHGWIEESEYPAMAALVAAMIATGKSLGGLGESLGEPSRFSCEFEGTGLYTVAIGGGSWLVALYEQPVNPGLIRMKIRRYAQTCARLGTERPDQWELDEVTPKTGAILPPVSSDTAPTPAKSTAPNSSLFTNITDDEIDRLFDNSSS